MEQLTECPLPCLITTLCLVSCRKYDTLGIVSYEEYAKLLLEGNAKWMGTLCRSIDKDPELTLPPHLYPRQSAHVSCDTGREYNVRKRKRDERGRKMDKRENDGERLRSLAGLGWGKELETC